MNLNGKVLLMQPTPSFAGSARYLLAAVLLGWGAARPAIADPLHMLNREGVEAQFRGCTTTGGCRFSLDGSETLYRVRPDGIPRAPEHSARSRAVRDRLNALLSSMIHQHKRIVLRDLRELPDGTHAARVIINEADVAEDELLRSVTGEK